MVTKGQIYKELGKNLDILNIWSNWMMNYDEKLENFIFL